MDDWKTNECGYCRLKDQINSERIHTKKIVKGPKLTYLLYKRSWGGRMNKSRNLKQNNNTKKNTKKNNCTPQ